jgi:hypothetical protein
LDVAGSARRHHGFIGQEEEVVARIASWMRNDGS